MKDILTQLFGDAVTDDVIKQFNAELGKKFVAKADFNAKVEEIKALKGEKKTLEDEISKLNENSNSNEDVKKELEALKSKIEADARQAEADRILKEKQENVLNRFNAVVGDKKFSHDAVKADYLKKFGDALENKDFEGKSDADVFHALTKDDASAFVGVTTVKLAGGRPQGVGKTYNSKEDIMAIKDRAERRQAIAENPSLFGITKGE